VCRPRVWFEGEDRRRAIPGRGLTRNATGCLGIVWNLTETARRAGGIRGQRDLATSGQPLAVVALSDHADHFEWVVRKISYLAG